MNKTMWARPNARVEEFAANEYVAACYDYYAQLYCAIPGSSTSYVNDGTQNGVDSRGLWHGGPCATSSTFKVSGGTGEETGEKAGNAISDIKIGAAITSNDYKTESCSSSIGTNSGMSDGVYYHATWTSYDGSTPYYHYGLAYVTGVEEIKGRPNHS